VRVAFVVNGPEDGAMGHRARAFAHRLGPGFTATILYRGRGKFRPAARFAAELSRFRPRVCYVLDMAAAGVLGGLAWKARTRGRLVIDTGDAITALAAAVGRGPVGRLLTAGLERVSLAAADRIVVRGTYHRQWLADRGVRAEFIPDGVETDLFAPWPAADLRNELKLGGVLTVGLVGSVTWNSRPATCYGWDLVELIRLLRDRPVVGVLIGDGSGLPVLRERCCRYDIEGRVRFLGRIPYEQLPRYLNAIDVCLSTQTDDLVGRVRTTGKLPLYLACGRYVLASRVGEAARVLGDAMLVEYRGTTDPDYPARLAERVVGLLDNPARLDLARVNVAVARAHFDYGVLADRVRRLLEAVAA
jgi:glycosyltransferase involved in cell wall biosynthesis